MLFVVKDFSCGLIDVFWGGLFEFYGRWRVSLWINQWVLFRFFVFFYSVELIDHFEFRLSLRDCSLTCRIFVGLRLDWDPSDEVALKGSFVNFEMAIFTGLWALEKEAVSPVPINFEYIDLEACSLMDQSVNKWSSLISWVSRSSWLYSANFFPEPMLFESSSF